MSNLRVGSGRGGGKTLQVLLVEDSASDAALLLLELQCNGYEIQSERVETAGALKDALVRRHWDVVFSDWSMPEFDAPAALAIVQKQTPDLPFIIVSGTIGEETAVDAMRAGAFDFITKSHLFRLAPVLEKALKESVVRLEHRKAEARIRYLAYHDPLTGLSNYAAFLENVAARCSPGSDATQVVCVIRLANYEEILATLGPENAGIVIMKFAERFKALTGGVEAAYLEGNQFALVWRGGNDDTNAEIQKIQDVLRKPVEVANLSLNVPLHMGISLCPKHGTDAKKLVHYARVALSRVAQSGEMALIYSARRDPYDPQRLVLLSELRISLERDELIPYYQPKIALATGQWAGVETLMRWPSLQRGFVPPDQFIPLAEQSGLIGLLTINLLRRIIRQIRQWRERGLIFPVALNLSAKNLLDRAVAAELLAVSSEDCVFLEIEITETTLMERMVRVLDILHVLRSRGVRISIDDFGTGYSSLAYLASLPIDTLKIDRMFITNIADDPKAMAIVSSIIALAHGLQLKVVAEGVETEDQRKLLRLLQCDEMQGFYFSPPVPAEEIEVMFVAHSAKKTN